MDSSNGVELHFDFDTRVMNHGYKINRKLSPKVSRYGITSCLILVNTNALHGTYKVFVETI